MPFGICDVNSNILTLRHNKRRHDFCAEDLPGSANRYSSSDDGKEDDDVKEERRREESGIEPVSGLEREPGAGMKNMLLGTTAKTRTKELQILANRFVCFGSSLTVYLLTTTTRRGHSTKIAKLRCGRLVLISTYPCVSY